MIDMGIKPVNLSVGVKTLELGLTAVDLKLDFNHWICTRHVDWCVSCAFWL